MRTLQFTAQDIVSGSLILINPSHPIQSQVSRSQLVLAYPDSADILLEKQTAKMLSEVMTLLNCGDEIIPVSGYRTLQEQQKIYTHSVRERGNDFAQQYVALPGCSEHQTGLAVDLAENKGPIDFIRPDFPYTGICARFREYSVRYGFIERYPAGREHVTHIAHEPWHFRYVGYPHSEVITRENITLEEYTEYLKKFTSPGNPLHLKNHACHYEVFYLPIQNHRKAMVKISDGTPYQVSGNNVDGVVVTLWKMD